MFAPLLRVRSISDMTLELLEMEANWAKEINTPFQIRERHLYGLAEIIRILSFECDLHRLAYVEAVFGQLHGISVVNHLILVRQ